MKQSLRNKILILVQSTDGRVSGLEIERFAGSLGFKNSNGSRRARELAQDRLIVAGYEHGLVYYTRVTQKEKPTVSFVEKDGQRIAVIR